jgi:hypothetical protein
VEEADAPELIRSGYGRVMLNAIKRAYNLRANGHRPGDGDNATTFGMNVRFSIEKFFEDAVIHNGAVSISRPAGSFQAVHLGHVYHFYKFGSNPSDSVDDLELDNSETKINIVAHNQLSLPGIPDLRDLIVAHSGNPEDGLLEVYVGAPNGLGHDGSPWAWRVCAYSAEGVPQKVQKIAPAVKLQPSFLEQPEPSVKVVRKIRTSIKKPGVDLA